MFNVFRWWHEREKKTGARMTLEVSNGCRPSRGRSPATIEQKRQHKARMITRRYAR